MQAEKEALLHLYRKRANLYDITANLYRLLGVREDAYRRQAVDALHLRYGDIVVEVGCGTGLNFSLMLERIGPTGHLIGVDLTDEMLYQAQKRIQRANWTNVSLVQMDAAQFTFPADVNGIISTFASTLVPEYDRVIRNGARGLAAGGHWVVLDFKKPERWPLWLLKFWVWLSKPFGVRLELASRHPWESLQHALGNITLDEFYGGMVYIASGQKRQTTA